MRGVTVRMIPASLYSTVWVPTIELVPVDGVAPIGTCCEVRIGTERDTLMTAFLFSAVMMDGLERTLTLFSLASRLMAATNSLAAKAKTFRPGGRAGITKGGMRSGGFGGMFVGLVKVALKRPCWRAHWMPMLVDSSSVTSAAAPRSAPDAACDRAS